MNWIMEDLPFAEKCVVKTEGQMVKNLNQCTIV